jgi:hypothetical protein
MLAVACRGMRCVAELSRLVGLMLACIALRTDADISKVWKWQRGDRRRINRLFVDSAKGVAVACFRVALSSSV